MSVRFSADPPPEREIAALLPNRIKEHPSWYLGYYYKNGDLVISISTQRPFFLGRSAYIFLREPVYRRGVHIPKPLTPDGIRDTVTRCVKFLEALA